MLHLDVQLGNISLSSQTLCSVHSVSDNTIQYKICKAPCCRGFRGAGEQVYLLTNCLLTYCFFLEEPFKYVSYKQSLSCAAGVCYFIAVALKSKQKGIHAPT